MKTLTPETNQAERKTLDEADNVVPKSISKVVNGNIIVIDQFPMKQHDGLTRFNQ